MSGAEGESGSEITDVYSGQNNWLEFDPMCNYVKDQSKCYY